MLMIEDEMGAFYADDGLRRELRKVSGVPNAGYEVLPSQGVFVFEKLVSLVRQHQKTVPELDIAVAATELMPKAVVSIEEAITVWHIIPTPYKVEAGQIVHGPFNAVLPAVPDINAALGEILSGGIVEGDGEFEFQGQKMTFRASIDPELLPARPELDQYLPADIDEESLRWGWRGFLAATNYQPGLPPPTESIFNKVKTWGMEWGLMKAKCDQFFHDRAKLKVLWDRLQSGELQLAIEATPSDYELDEFALEELVELRQCYPELASWSDVMLYHRYASFMANEMYIRRWTPNRYEDFLFYLLAHNVDGIMDGRRCDGGKWYGLLLLSNVPHGESAALARMACEYDHALTNLGSRINSASQFLMQENFAQAWMFGHEIVTMLDCFSQARSKPFKVDTTAVQSINDFPAEVISASLPQDAQ